MRQCESIVERARGPKPSNNVEGGGRRRLSFGHRAMGLFRRGSRAKGEEEEKEPQLPTRSPAKKHFAQKERHDSSRKVRADMIRRMDAPPKLVDPNGWMSEGAQATVVEEKPQPIASSPEGSEGSPGFESESNSPDRLKRDGSVDGPSDQYHRYATASVYAAVQVAKYSQEGQEHVAEGGTERRR